MEESKYVGMKIPEVIIISFAIVLKVKLCLGKKKYPFCQKSRPTLKKLSSIYLF